VHHVILLSYFCPQESRKSLKNSRCAEFWVVDVYKDGLYEISVRRWPEEADIPINEAPEKGWSLSPLMPD